MPVNKMHLKISSAKCRQFDPVFKVLIMLSGDATSGHENYRQSTFCVHSTGIDFTEYRFGWMGWWCVCKLLRKTVMSMIWFFIFFSSFLNKFFPNQNIFFNRASMLPYLRGTCQKWLPFRRWHSLNGNPFNYLMFWRWYIQKHFRETKCS